MSENLKSVIEIGMSVSIKHTLKNGDILTLKSNIMQIPGDDYVVITAPIHEAKIFNIHTDKHIEVLANKASSGTYSFKSKVADRFKKNNLHMILLERIGPIGYAQRRDFYRHSILLTVKVDILTEEGLIAESMNAMTKDISGGGLRLVIKKKLKAGTLVRCNIPINNEIISPIGEVVRVDIMKDSTVLNETAISFTDVTERERAKIISYIFKCQQKSR